MLSSWEWNTNASEERKNISSNRISQIVKKRKHFVRLCLIAIKPEVVSKSAWLRCQFIQQALITHMLLREAEGKGEAYIS